MTSISYKYFANSFTCGSHIRESNKFNNKVLTNQNTCVNCSCFSKDLANHPNMFKC